MKTVEENLAGQLNNRPNSEIDSQFITEYLLWGDQKIINILKILNDQEFNKSFGELAGSVHSKTAHILSIYEYFISIFEGNPHQGFPDLSHLTREELISRWEQIVVKWPDLVARIDSNETFPMSLAGDQRLEASHIFVDAAMHTIHHRGQILTFVRLLGKNKEEVNPRDTNLDYIMFMFNKHADLIHPANK